MANFQIKKVCKKCSFEFYIKQESIFRIFGHFWRKSGFRTLQKLQENLKFESLLNKQITSKSKLEKLEK